VAISATGIVYYCGRGGGLRWADANGEISSISLSSSEIRVPPSIDGNGFVYVSCTDGRMYRFDPAKAKFTSFNLKSGALWSAPTIDRNGWIYVGTSGGAFVRIK
jgi:outer membrane protein assembly factor BamB